MNININGKIFSNCEDAIGFLTELSSKDFLKIKEAVRTISDYCADHRNCMNCPFSLIEDECVLKHSSPNHWDKIL